MSHWMIYWQCLPMVKNLFIDTIIDEVCYIWYDEPVNYILFILSKSFVTVGLNILFKEFLSSKKFNPILI